MRFKTMSRGRTRRSRSTHAKSRILALEIKDLLAHFQVRVLGSLALLDELEYQARLLELLAQLLHLEE